MTSSWKLGLAVAAIGLSVSSAEAGAITCLPNNERVATLDSATSCSTANEVIINDSPSLNGVLGTSNAWVMEGTLSPEPGTTGSLTNDLLTVTLLTGSWGGNSGITGTWTIDPSFWNTLNYTIAAITMHVGQGQGNPDAFAWLITPGATSGTFSYVDLDGKGGGLSNMRLFGTEPTTTTGGSGNVPEPDHALLMVVGMLSVLALRFGGPRLLKARQNR
jgi:hypothetical protein